MTADALYHEALVALARARTGAGALAAPDAAATRDNPMCGDRVTLEVALEGDRIAALAHRVRGCVLCQAAAALLGLAAPGRAVSELAAAREQVSAFLGGRTPSPGWAELAIFTPVREVPSRHACVLLPFDALCVALGRARG